MLIAAVETTNIQTSKAEQVKDTSFSFGTYSRLHVLFNETLNGNRRNEATN